MTYSKHCYQRGYKGGGLLFRGRFIKILILRIIDMHVNVQQKSTL